MLTEAQERYMIESRRISGNYTRTQARVERARRVHNLAPCPESYAKYIKTLDEARAARDEYYS